MATHSARPQRRARVALARATCAAAAALFLQAAPGQARQIPPSVEFRVPKPPTVAHASTGAFIAYELHITNLTASPLTLRRVDVLHGATHAPLLSVGDSALLRDIARLGQNVPLADRARIGGGLRAIVYVWAPLDAAAAPRTLHHRLTFQRDTAAASSFTLEGALIDVAPPAPAIGPPLRGEWVALNGPSNASGHRRLVLALNGSLASGQRFGADFLQVGADDRSFTGDRTRNENFHAYGEEILAVADGIVVAIRDGIPENVPGGRAVPIDLETVGGNYILIDIGGRYAFYAHVVPGSLRVRVGDRVARGQVVALVGNSGNSTEPHLHFHVVDGIAEGTTTLGAEGIPYALEQFQLEGECSLSGAAIMCERAAPTTVRRGLPLQNQIVRFPQ